MFKIRSADIGIICGTGFTGDEFFGNSKEIKVNTPYGAPSDPITIGNYYGMEIAFISRHGKSHTIPPHKINNRANIWALKELGVKRIIALCAVGSLNYQYKIGDFVIPDQFVDFTKKREITFYDTGPIEHFSLVDPFCVELIEIANNTMRKSGYLAHDKGTYICIEGPRFSTVAESKFFMDVIQGDIIGMTLAPECTLAREVGLCYCSIALVTDCNLSGMSHVSANEIRTVLESNSEKTKKMIRQLIPNIPTLRTCCSCNTVC